MILSAINGIIDNGNDYLLLIDYGCEGIAVNSQHETLGNAMIAMNKGNYGSPTAIVKVCRIKDPIEI